MKFPHISLRRGAIASAIAITATAFGLTLATPASSQVPSTFVQTISIPANGSSNGLLITGPTTGLVNELEIKDGFGQPIFAVGNDGGPKAFGDDISVYAGDDIFLPVAYMTPDTITPGTSCPKDNAIAIGGGIGGIFKCRASDNVWQRLL